MSKIRIKNFGPIKEGCLENDGWIDIKKVTVFIGNQGSGKSTVAKVFSTLSWIEKSINRGDIKKEEFSFKMFHELFEYQGINEYFSSESTIEYIGNKYSIRYDRREHFPLIELVRRNGYSVPKIMYVPAERNFLSTIQDAFGVKGLPEHLFTFAEELKKAQKNYRGKQIGLPINNYNYQYDETSGASFVVGKDHRVNLLQASSGFQSAIPLFIVTRYLANLIKSRDIFPRENMSVRQSIRMNEELATATLDKSLTDDAKQKQIKRIQAKFINQCFINIVEEPEQNLFPTSQRLMLNSLLKYNNIIPANKLLITTHSPYIINYLTLAVKAYFLKNQLHYESVYTRGSLKSRLIRIVPLGAAISPENVNIYEFDSIKGSITKLNDYNGIPSDDNQLNKMMGDTNELFAQLLEIQQEL